jgi:RecA/RadA recombinase
MAKDYMRALNKIEGAVDKSVNPFANGIRTPSPSANFVFGNSHLLPYGYTLIMYGPPAGGKSVLLNAIIGQLHQDDPDAIAVKYDTEFRETAQNTQAKRSVWKIDDNRYIAYDVNHPELIFDKIEKDVAALCQDGAPIKLVAIDSINAIQGRRATNAETIMTQQIGDQALTLQEGFKRILPVQRRYGFAVILTSHVRAEMDMAEQMRGNKVKMGASFGVQHYGEYFMYVEPNRSKEGSSTLLGQKLENENFTDLMDKAERTGHKIRVCMKKSSLGPKLRTGEFTLDYQKGIINTHEEVFLLGVNRNIFRRPNNRVYEFGNKSWDGKPAMLDAIKNDSELYNSIVSEIKTRDLKGMYALDDERAAVAEELGSTQAAAPVQQEA